MAKRKVEEIVEDICKPITDSLGLKLIDTEYKKEGSQFVLRVVIDKPDGIVIEDCENVSRELSAKLDEIDPIEQSYSLEVQSPGERNLKKDREYEYFSGRDVEVKLYDAMEEKKMFEGKLVGLENDMVKITLENGEIKEFPKHKVANVKLKIKF